MNSTTSVLITGATGFIGSRVCERINDDGVMVRRALHQGGGLCDVVVGDIGQETDWSTAFAGIDCVVHLAARVHIMNDNTADPLAEFRRVNVTGTLNLARQSAAMGVRRFVYISSIKVNGEQTLHGNSFTADDKPAPIGHYGVSKHEAEEGLLALAAETSIEIVIIRPPLVYGPGVKANFISMMRWLYKGLPLPLGAVHNKRSLIALENLVDLIVTCIDHPAAANQIFLASDDEDLSTMELLQRMAVALGKPARLLPVPVWLLKAGATLIGKRDLAQRLLGSLQVDISKTKEVLGWTPPVSVDEALRKTADDFLSREVR